MKNNINILKENRRTNKEFILKQLFRVSSQCQCNLTKAEQFDVDTYKESPKLVIFVARQLQKMDKADNLFDKISGEKVTLETTKSFTDYIKEVNETLDNAV